MLRRVTAKSGVSRPTSICSTIGAAVGVLVLDGVLDRHHVRRAPRIDDVDQGRECGGLAAAGRARDQHQSLPAVGELGERGGQMQRFERRDREGSRRMLAASVPR